MQHSLKLFILLGLVGSLSACGLPRASDINPPPEPDTSPSLDDPRSPLIIPAPQQPSASEGIQSESIELEEAESAAIEATPVTSVELTNTPETEPQAAPEDERPDAVAEPEQTAQ
ncbi:MAG: hypothetical protein AAGG51_23865 [Cyanobacteria bacterium P01_G01_bin.54]